MAYPCHAACQCFDAFLAMMQGGERLIIKETDAYPYPGYPQ